MGEEEALSVWEATEGVGEFSTIDPSRSVAVLGPVQASCWWISVDEVGAGCRLYSSASAPCAGIPPAICSTGGCSTARRSIVSCSIVHTCVILLLVPWLC